MTGAGEYAYLIALGSNERHASLGSPRQILRHSFDALEMADIFILAASSIRSSKPIGASRREYANAAAILISPLNPPSLLARIKMLEAHFGRRKSGERWRARSLDIDIILWSGGGWSSRKPNLIIPHPQWRHRHFVLAPAAEIAADWRDPASGHHIKQLLQRMKRANRLDPARRAN